jgi:hypothetical protein
VEHMFEAWPMVETLEHWWNGLAGTINRRDVWLRRNPAGPLWEIEVKEAGRTAMGEFASEAEARQLLGEITTAGLGTWRRERLS